LFEAGGLLRTLVRKQKESPGAPRNSHKLKVIVFTREISLAGYKEGLWLENGESALPKALVLSSGISTLVRILEEKTLPRDQGCWSNRVKGAGFRVSIFQMLAHLICYTIDCKQRAVKGSELYLLRQPKGLLQSCLKWQDRCGGPRVRVSLSTPTRTLFTLGFRV
jgi:hypothetical protein